MGTVPTRIHVAEDVFVRGLGDETVLLKYSTGKYYQLDKIGTRMWTLLTQHGQVEPAYRALLEQYDVPADKLRHDLIALIDELVAHGLLCVDSTQS